MSLSERPGWSLRRLLATRLTLALGGSLAIVLFVLDYRIDTEVYAHLDKLLGAQTQTVVDGLTQGGIPAHISMAYGPPAHTDHFTLYGPQGTPVLTSPNSNHVALALPPVKSTLPRYYDLRSPDDVPARALAVALNLNATDHVLVVSTERADWDTSERRIHRTLIATIAIATAMVVGFVLLIVRSAFAPLMRHGVIVASLEADSPPKSLDSGLPRELAPFAEAIEAGIGRLYGAIGRERRFSRDIAHELRTPLAEIRATAEVALRNGEASALRAGLTTAIAATERMQRSVDTLLALARFESGQEAPALDPLDLAAVASAQIAALHHSAQTRGITIVLEGAGAAWIHSDIGIIERILSNLLQNAIEYAPAGSRVDCRLQREEGGYTLSIENDAPGLMGEDLPRFGARFWRKHVEGGTAQHAGLGLALCLALSRSLGVRLEFGLHEGRLQACLGRFDAL